MFNLPLLGMLKTKMHWHQARQTLLAQNIANADTPGFRPTDLNPLGQDAVRPAPAVTQVAVSRTSSGHIAGGAIGAKKSGFNLSDAKSWEKTPGGNSVVLEEQMIKLSANQFDFQTATTLYSRSIGLLKTAIGRRA